jgi:hypothetical protein
VPGRATCSWAASKAAEDFLSSCFAGEEEEEDELLVRACGKEVTLEQWLQEQQLLLDAAKRQRH